MLELDFPWLAAALGVLSVAACAMLVLKSPDASWRLALAATAAAGLAVIAAVSQFAAAGTALADPLAMAMSDAPLVFVDAVSAVMLPFAAVLWSVAVLISPRQAWRRDTLRRLLLGEACALATLATAEPLLLAVLWGLSTAILLRAIRGRRDDGRQAIRVLAVHGVGSALLLGAGALAMRGGPDGHELARGLPLFVAATWLRVGVAPFHAWVPNLFERAPFGAAVPFGASHLGAYVFVRLVAPDAPDHVLAVGPAVGLLTAILAAGAAIVQRDARRAFGYLTLAQSGILIASLTCGTEAGIVGGLLFMLASGLALAGAGLTLRILEARRGDLPLHVLHGGFDRMPHLAWSFLLFGLALAGLPATLGFASEELILGALAERHVVAAMALVAVSALTGIAVMRMYFSLFCGRRTDGHDPQPLRSRERAGIVVLAVILVATGIWPGPLARVAGRAATAIDARNGR